MSFNLTLPAFAVLSLAACGPGGASQPQDEAAPRVADPVEIERADLPNETDAAEAAEMPAAETAPAPDGAAQAWTVVREESSLTFEGSLDGDAFGGEFTEWNADIRFDPQNLAGSSIRGVVQPGSIDTGDSSQDETAASDDWLGGEEAVFSSSEIRQGETGYEAVGELTVNGETAPLTLPFTVTITGDRAEAQSEFTLERANWGIGGGDFDGAVSDAITVMLDITAEKAS